MKVKISNENGYPMFLINGEKFSPLLFRSNRAEKRSVSEFYSAGVRLMGVFCTGLNCTLDVPYSLFGENWLGIKNYDFSTVDSQIEMMLSYAPDVLFNVMIHLDTRPWYLANNPECTNTYYNLVEMAGYEKWRSNTAQYLEDIVNYIESRYGEKVFSYSLICGSSMEWYTNSQGNGKPEAEIRYNKIKEECFRKYIGDKKAELPANEELHKTSDGVFRHPEKDKRSVDYWHFHHNIIGDTICFFAKKLREITDGNKLIGLFYGYLVELYGERLLNEGQLGYEKVWQCEDIDMIYAPAAYSELRTFEGTSGFLNTVDSLKIHNKMMYHEIDHTTYISPQYLENGRAIPGHDSKLKNEFESAEVLKREFVMCEAKRVGMWWFDFFGGHFYSRGLMQTVDDIIRVKNVLSSVKMRSASEIAVFADVESSFYISAQSSVAKDTVRNMRGFLNLIGAPYDLYNLSDITSDNIESNDYKVYILLNAFYVEGRIRDYIENLKDRGKTVIFIYAPGYIGKKDNSVGYISELVSINIKKLDCDCENIVCSDNLSPALKGVSFGFSSSFSPGFYVEDDSCETLGVYEKNGKPGFVRKGNIYYCAVGNIPSDVLREIVRRAGVHIYCEGASPVYVNDRIIGIHVRSDEEKIILPQKSSAKELFSGEYIPETEMITIKNQNGKVKLFLLK